MDLLVGLFKGAFGIYIITAIWVAAGFLILAVLRTAACWWLDFIEWVKGLFKGGD
jgi:hypothetical protein